MSCVKKWRWKEPQWSCISKLIKNSYLLVGIILRSAWASCKYPCVSKMSEKRFEGGWSSRNSQVVEDWKCVTDSPDNTLSSGTKEVDLGPHGWRMSVKCLLFLDKYFFNSTCYQLCHLIIKIKFLNESSLDKSYLSGRSCCHRFCDKKCFLVPCSKLCYKVSALVRKWKIESFVSLYKIAQRHPNNTNLAVPL